ncbi:hypothetical protein [Streptomyces sp. URMC 123]|uniref:hypothetical protein n=1 Tax=Streptomyces sp. URMC 123 TaxID=3423403 RepID=UPI003F1C3EC0
MAEAESGIRQARVVVHGVNPGDPPFRVVEVNGVTVGLARGIVDVINFAHRAGLTKVDVDDPADVRWVEGDKWSWMPRHHRG